MKKVVEFVLIGAAAYVSGMMYEQGRKAGKDTSKIDPAAWASAVGSRISRKRLADLIEQARKAAAN